MANTKKKNIISDTDLDSSNVIKQIVKKKSENDKIKNQKEKNKKESVMVLNNNSESKNIDNTNNKILIPCKIPNFVKINILKECVKKDLESNKEYFDDLKITYKISDPKKAEWLLSKSIENSKLVGNGSTNIDISVGDNVGIDVSVLTLNGNNTNEKSIMQNFSNSNDLDTLFNTNQGEQAVEIFRKKFQEKCSFKDGKKKDMYYMIFICKNQNVYISCLKLNPEYIPNMKFSGFTQSCKNISIDNFIDDKIGNVKLYKSKKRLELRLCKDIINNDCSTKLY